MTEDFLLGIFSAALIACVATGLPILSKFGENTPAKQLGIMNYELGIVDTILIPHS